MESRKKRSLNDWRKLDQPQEIQLPLSPLTLSFIPSQPLPTMLLKTNRKTYFSIFTSFALFASFSFYLSRLIYPSNQISPSTIAQLHQQIQQQQLPIQQQSQHNYTHHKDLQYSPPQHSVLLPDWEVLLIFPPASPPPSCRQCRCFYPNNNNNVNSPAVPTGVLPFTRRPIFKCLLPRSTRRILPFPQPVVAELHGGGAPPIAPPPGELLRWHILAYEVLSTGDDQLDDVILFVKGVNGRQGVNAPPENLRCIFFFEDDAVRTSVTSSNQEVFRCLRPPNGTLSRRFLSGGKGSETVKVSLEVGQGEERRVVPSVAYYAPWRKIALGGRKSLLCACTMVYNVAKFLREWVVYHSKIGVDRFVLYDNGSDDGLEKVVKKLLEEEYEVDTVLWPWTKTQEAGFSHCAMYAKDSCIWMMYIDVDEFIYSPSWLNALFPSPQMLKSFLPINPSSSLSSSSPLPIGQILIWCYEYGPSNQTAHPKEGVTQGYTCRRNEEQRHKSIVLVEAIDASLFNAIHHFQLKERYIARTLSANEGVVNHYKFQAWPEFMLKFRRRVSAYVVDWRQALNPMSNDRTPGLGFEPIEPKGWTQRFCEVHDERLKEATRRWFGVDSSDGYKMAWQEE